MKRCMALSAALAILVGGIPAWAGSPFLDVPPTHWAYDAVEELSSRTILEGYPDKTIRGNRAMSRYEIAQVVARLMVYSDEFKEVEAEKLKALVAEFEPELQALGVKIDGIDARLSDIEKNFKGWRIYGQMRFDLNLWDVEMDTSDESANGFNMDRARIYLHKDLAQKVTFDARWNSDNVDRFYLQARDFLGIKGFTFKAGQFFLDWEAADDTYIDNDAYAMDTTYRGIQLTKSLTGLGTVTAFAASMRGSGTYGVYTDNPSDEVYGFRGKFNFNEKLWMSINGLVTNRGDNNYKHYWMSAGWRFMKGAELKGTFYMEDIADDTVVSTLSGRKVDDPQSWKAILQLDQNLLGFTGLWLEYAQIDEGYILDHNPWAFSDVEWPSSSYTWKVTSDTEVYFARAEQKWSKRWSTFERYTEYNPDEMKSYDEWTLAVVFRYTPQLSFELAYDDQNGRRNNSSYENKQIRLRTFFQF